jgi:hypothetical protein
VNPPNYKIGFRSVSEDTILEDNEHVVETPWGKLVTAKGLNVLLQSFMNDINRLHSNLAKIDERINKLEMSISSVNSSVDDPLLASSLTSIENDLENLKKEQSRFAMHMKQTLELFYSKLDQVSPS